MSFFSSILDPMPNLWFKLCLYLYSNCQSYFCHNQSLLLILSIIMFIYKKCLLHTLTYTHTHTIFWTKNITWTYDFQHRNCDFYAKVVSVQNRHCSQIYYKELWWLMSELDEKRKGFNKIFKTSSFVPLLILVKCNHVLYNMKKWIKGVG